MVLAIVLTAVLFLAAFSNGSERVQDVSDELIIIPKGKAPKRPARRRKTKVTA